MVVTHHRQFYCNKIKFERIWFRFGPREIKIKVFSLRPLKICLASGVLQHQCVLRRFELRCFLSNFKSDSQIVTVSTAALFLHHIVLCSYFFVNILLHRYFHISFYLLHNLVRKCSHFKPTILFVTLFIPLIPKIVVIC